MTESDPHCLPFFNFSGPTLVEQSHSFQLDVNSVVGAGILGNIFLSIEI